MPPQTTIHILGTYALFTERLVPLKSSTADALKTEAWIVYLSVTEHAVCEMPPVSLTSDCLKTKGLVKRRAVLELLPTATILNVNRSSRANFRFIIQAFLDDEPFTSTRRRKAELGRQP